MSRRQTAFLALAATGLLTFVLGLIWDSSLHAADPTLAEHEGIFTLSNPGHLLMAIGIGLTTLGVLCALGEALVQRASRPRRARLTVGAGAVIAAFGLAAAGAIAAGGDHHAHGAQLASAPAGGHAHGHGKHAGPPLPANTKVGDAHRLQQFPDVSGASGADRGAAQKLYDQTVRATAAYRDVKAAEAAGYKVEAKLGSEMQSQTGKHKLLLHVGNRAYKRDGHTLDPSHPETLVYYNPPGGGSPVLAGALFSIPRDQAPPATGGTITRWHFHDHCVDSASMTSQGSGHKALKQLKAQGKATTPGAEGSCPTGYTKLEGKRLMMHVWFTGDLRSAFAVHAPKQQLRAALTSQ